MVEEEIYKMEGHIQAKFISSQTSFKIPDAVFSLPSSSGVEELNGLINKILGEDENWIDRQFDFLINGTLFRVNLSEFISDNDLSSEDVISIECVLREEAPSPEFSLPHEDWVGAVRASNNIIVTACYDNTICIWSRKTNERMLTIPAHTGAVKCLAWVPSNELKSKMFVSGSQDQTITVWKYDLENNHVSSVVVGRGHERSVESVCSNAVGTRVASGSFDSYLKIWNVGEKCFRLDSEIKSSHQTEEQAHKKVKTNNNKTIVTTPMVTLAGHKESISGVCWTDIAEVVTCSWDHTLILWDLEMAGQKSTLAGNKAFTCVSHSPFNNQLLTGSVDRHIRLWDPRSKALTSAKMTFTSHTGWVVAVDWSKTNENLFISASYDKLMKLWDTRSNKVPLYDLSGHEDRILCCDWSSADVLLSGGVDNCVKVYSSSNRN